MNKVSLKICWKAFLTDIFGVWHAGASRNPCEVYMLYYNYSVYKWLSYVIGTGTIVWLPQCQWSNPEGYGDNHSLTNQRKHNKTRAVCVIHKKYCTRFSVAFFVYLICLIMGSSGPLLAFWFSQLRAMHVLNHPGWFVKVLLTLY